VGSITIRERESGDVTILEIEGGFFIGCGDPLCDKVKELIERGRIKVLLDLAQVTYICSAGLGEFVRSYVILKRNRGELKLLRLREDFRDVLRRTTLIDVFEILDDERVAIMSFRSQERPA
jgi:anti-anti-sigma factor